MAMNLMTPQNGGGRRRNRMAVNSAINVTPLIDVLLVLLVVFMITAPMLTVGVPVDLPKTHAPNIPEQKQQPLIVSVVADGRVFLNESEVQLESLPHTLQALTVENPDLRIFVRGDQALNYGRIMQVMGTLSQAGFKKVALLAELPNGSAAKAPAPGKTGMPAGAPPIQLPKSQR